MYWQSDQMQAAVTEARGMIHHAPPTGSPMLTGTVSPAEQRPGAAVTLPPPENMITVVPADVALHLLGRGGLADYRRKHRGENGRVDDVLLGMSEAAYRWRELADNGRNRAPTTDSGTESLTTGQVAERAGVSTRTVRRAIENGTLPTHRAGHIHLITRADAADWTRRNRQ